jgi:PAS domain S-box-containing protein
MIKILTIVENKDDLFELKALLSKPFPNAVLFFTENGKKGIEISRTEHPDVILLDLEIPVGDGIDALVKLKNDKQLNNIPVIILTTAKSDKKSRIKALDLGADAFLLKPFDEAVLTAQIKTMFRIKESEYLRRNEAERLSLLVNERTWELEKELQERKKVENELRMVLNSVEISKKASLDLLENLKVEIEERRNVEEALRESEERFRMIFEKSELGITLQRHDFTFIKANRAFCSMIGYSETELSKISFAQITIAENKEENIQTAAELWNGTIPYYGAEKGYYHKNGSIIWVLISVTVIRNNLGEPLHYLTMVNNITEGRKIERKLAQERTILRTLIDNLPHTIYVKDLEKRKILANQADLKLIGKNESEVIGKTDQEIFPPSEAELFDVDDDLVLTTGKAVLDREELIVNPEGQGIWLLTSKLPLYDHEGKITGLIGIGHDITTRKLAENELRESEIKLKKQNEEYFQLNKKYLILNEELTKSLKHIHKINFELQIAVDKAEESDRLKLAFLSNMSHEIRTPMNAIMGFSEFLTKSELPVKKRKIFAQIITSSCDQLLTIINDILDISKIEAGQISMFQEVFSLDDLLNELYVIFEIQVKEKGLNLIYHKPNRNETLQLNTDKNRLRQVLNNLLSNALKFTEVGEIEYGYKINNDHLELFVRDTGIGVATENYSLIFERFHQVDSGCTRKFGGNGLGLSISKSLVEKMGGKVTLKSIEEKGTVFFINLPAEIISNNIIKPNRDKPEFVLPGKYKREILIVEDEINNFLLIEELLIKEEIKILHAWNGKEAVDMFIKNPAINMILMDIKMPVMDGFEAMQLIKVKNPDIPIIAVTAFAMMEDKEKALRAGFDNYISKPIKKDILMKMLAEYPFQKK